MKFKPLFLIFVILFTLVYLDESEAGVTNACNRRSAENNWANRDYCCRGGEAVCDICNVIRNGERIGATRYVKEYCDSGSCNDGDCIGTADPVQEEIQASIGDRREKPAAVQRTPASDSNIRRRETVREQPRPAAIRAQPIRTVTVQPRQVETARPTPDPVQQISSLSKITANSGTTQRSGFDTDNSGVIDFPDFLNFSASFNSVKGRDRNFNPAFDTDNSGVIDFADFLVFSSEFGKNVASGKPTGDGVRARLDCNTQCTDLDGCSCSDSCKIEGDIAIGGTCGGSKPPAIVSIVQRIFNIELKVFEVKNTRNGCNRDLRKGERCEVEFDVEILAAKDERIDVDVDFTWNQKGHRVSSTLVVGDENVATGSRGNLITARVVLDINDGPIQNLVTNHGRFRCEITPSANTCCPIGYEPSIQTGVSQCVKISSVQQVLTKPSMSLYERFAELAGEYLRSTGGERERLRRELESLQ